MLNLKKDNYRNEWEFKSKAVPQIGAKISLHCKMTMDYFSLAAMIFVEKRKIFEKEVLRTLPDEILFANSFKDVIFERGRFVILNFLKRPYASISWPSLILTYNQDDVARILPEESIVKHKLSGI